MEFKHIAFTAALASSIWALFIGCMTSIEDLGNIELKSELSEINKTSGDQSNPADNSFEEAPIENKFKSIVDVLNLGLPIGLGCLLLLGITYKANPIGFYPLIFLVALFFFSSTKTMDAVHLIEAQSEFTVGARVWWM